MHQATQGDPTHRLSLDVVHRPAAYCYLDSRHLLHLGPLIPECSGLSQFKEDTGEPSIRVREFNLIACPLVQLC